jgi:hypothetical protein
VFTTPSGRRLTGSAAYLTAKKLKDEAKEKGLIPASQGRRKKKKTGKEEGNGDEEERKEGKKTSRRKRRKDKSDGSDDEAQSQTRKKERKPRKVRKVRQPRERGEQVEEKDEGEGGGGADPSTTQSTSRRPSSRRRQVPTEESDSEAEWVPGTMRSRSEGDNSPDDGDGSDDSIQDFIEDEEDWI